MNLLAAFHAHWAASAALAARLPAERVWTGPPAAADPPPSFATLELAAVELVARTNDQATLYRATVAIEVVDGEFDSGLATAELVRAELASLTSASGGEVLSIDCDPPLPHYRAELSRWAFTVGCRLLVYRAAAGG